MADLHTTDDHEHSGHQGHSHGGPNRLLAGIDRAWAAVLALPLIVALTLGPTAAIEMLTFAGHSMARTGIFILLAMGSVAWLKASGAEAVLARAFVGREMRMILLAAILGGVSPFCSCEVIPFVAALLAVGAPLSAVMAFWLSSPLMDPAMFLITAGTLGLPFAIAKTVAAIALGIAGGLVVRAFATSAVFADPLRQKPARKGCGCGSNPFNGKPQWAFWTEAHRRETFRETLVENALFLGKWLALAYMFEALMVSHIPASLVAGLLGGEGLGAILLAAVLGAPAYLNGYAAVPLVSGLLSQGMAPGAAMAFVIAGGVSCIPAAIAVWALVKPRVFAAYVAIAFCGAIIAGVSWNFLT